MRRTFRKVALKAPLRRRALDQFRPEPILNDLAMPLQRLMMDTMRNPMARGAQERRLGPEV